MGKVLNKRTLARINAQPKQVNRPLIVLIGASSLIPAAAVLVLTDSLAVALATLAAGNLGVLLAYRAQKARMTTTLTYGNLQGDLRAHFIAVQEGCEALASSEKIWRLRGPRSTTRRGERRTGDAILPSAREPVRVGLLDTPGIRTDVAEWGIEAGNHTTLFFFPDAVLVYREGKGSYEGFSYESLQVFVSSVRFYERDDVPEDAEVVAGRTTHSRLPIVLYGLVEIRLSHDTEMRLQVSSRGAAARFGRAFGVKMREEPGKKQADRKQSAGQECIHQHEEQTEDTTSYYDSLSANEKARVASAFAALWVQRGASMHEISAAYKELARVHHPDKIANLPEEEREPLERRMKEINAAYTVLKRFGRGLAGGVG